MAQVYDAYSDDGFLTVLERYSGLLRLENIFQPGGTVTMLVDASLFLTLAIDIPVTVDLNGCTITSRNFDFFSVGAAGELTIVDSGEIGCVRGLPSGARSTIRVDGALKVFGGTFSVCEITGDGTLDFGGGNFPTTRIVGKDSKTTLVIRNGVFGTADHAFLCNIDTFKSIAVSGGEFYNLNDALFMHTRCSRRFSRQGTRKRGFSSLLLNPKNRRLVSPRGRSWRVLARSLRLTARRHR